MRTKILATLLVGGLFVGAGFVTSLVSPPAAAEARVESDTNENRRPIPRILGILGGVLDGLVEYGTLTRDQADAVVSAVEDEAVELREERGEGLEEARRHLRHHLRKGLRFGALFDDGGIDQEEYDSLDSDHPLKRLDVDDHLADGLITPDEFREVLQDLTDARLGDT